MCDVEFTFYGDDFTGSTDALEVLTVAGMKSVLFTKPPTSEMLAKYSGVQAVGLAGISRSLSPAEMEAELRPAFAALAALKPRHLHYKVCSTFDSSPQVGSIGRAIEIGCEYTSQPFVPVVGGNPVLGRYCVFGNLFGQAGVGHQGTIYRLDRHPTASRHPVTPMGESDLLVHLGKQTDKKSALFDVLALGLPADGQDAVLQKFVSDRAELILFDLLSVDQLPKVGRLIDNLAKGTGPLFLAGSSGVEMALAAYWQEIGKLAKRTDWPRPALTGQVLVASGSCSPVTKAQISRAISAGFAEIALDSCVLADKDCNSYLLKVSEDVVNLINTGRSVVVHSGQETTSFRRQDSPQTPTLRNESSLEYRAESAARLGAALGQIISSTVERTSLQRVCIAGGDTSSYAARELGVAALQMICPTLQGAPLCRASAPGQPVDGIEICFKGGQVGRDDYFVTLTQLGRD
jgi:3-oxoisoapionate kinase